jgi:hypothetical protein
MTLIFDRLLSSSDVVRDDENDLYPANGVDENLKISAFLRRKVKAPSLASNKELLSMQ